LGLKHASDQILPVIVETLANIVNVDAPAVILAVQ